MKDTSLSFNGLLAERYIGYITAFLILLSLSSCICPRSRKSVAGPWNIEAPKELQDVWVKFELAIKREDWPGALACCTTRTKEMAATYNGAMINYFQPLLDLKISFSMFPPDTPEAEQTLVITCWHTEDSLPPYVPFIQEGGGWKFRIPRSKSTK